ncbi:MAG: GNAT family N-acetyltransferase [FCB group bacterium]|nr:GNAT family N-acetyltransferase [FCB group bacterium]MBL7027497.1 GNAT family N-acetyltransferase [Candidatus Neomarinimicrobiota bacterium]MBL7122110.1 GNAT family N-acetyltransferase [Candidatus Neomarinimicrobiota bacterium]
MSFDLQPVLKGEKLSLRPLWADDYDDLFAVASDPLIWEQHPASTRYTPAVFKTLFQESMDSGGALIVQDAQSQEVIGSSRYYGYDEGRSEVEIGWTFLARSYWGGYYNAEMKRLMLEHAFQFVNNVVFLVGPQNIRSQRAVEKIGGVRGGSRVDGSGCESISFKITSDFFRVNGLSQNHSQKDSSNKRGKYAKNIGFSCSSSKAYSAKDRTRI